MAEIEIAINNYLFDVMNNRISIPGICEICSREKTLIWWSKYKRNLITFIKIFTDIPIKRVRCNACKGTFCILPKFILKFCHYGKDIIIYAIKELKKKQTFEEVAEKIYSRLSAEMNFAVRTLIFWKKKFGSINSQFV